MSASRLIVLFCVFVIGCVGEPEREPPAVEAEATVLAGLSGRAPRASGGFPSVIMIDPEDEGEGALEPGPPVVIDQRNSSFSPKIAVARPEESVQFTNSDAELHNVHVTDPSDGTTIFNVATPMSGAYTHRFDREGAFDVGCDIHPWMAAYIVVTSSPYVVIAEPDGRFSFPDLPRGSYRVRVWSQDPSRRVERTVTLDDSVGDLVLEPQS